MWPQNWIVYCGTTSRLQGKEQTCENPETHSKGRMFDFQESGMNVVIHPWPRIREIHHFVD